MFLAHYGRQDLPVLRSWDSLGRVVLQICRRYAAGSVRSGFWGKAVVALEVMRLCNL